MPGISKTEIKTNKLLFLKNITNKQATFSKNITFIINNNKCSHQRSSCCASAKGNIYFWTPSKQMVAVFTLIVLLAGVSHTNHHIANTLPASGFLVIPEAKHIKPFHLVLHVDFEAWSLNPEPRTCSPEILPCKTSFVSYNILLFCSKTAANVIDNKSVAPGNLARLGIFCFL